MDNQSECKLLQMPREVILRITSFLPTLDLGAVRLTCRALENSLFKSFSHEFFSKKQFMLTEQSLQALIDISKHPTLGPCLHHVIIASNHFTRSPHRNDNITPDQILQHRLGFVDQFCLLAAYRDQQMLAQAFSNLPNLETVDLRDFNSRTRYRDGPAAEWSSYGASTATNATGGGLMLLRTLDLEDFPSRIFTTLLAALASSTARPRALEVLARQGCGLQDRDLHIPRWLEPSLLPVLSSLEKVHLTVNFESSSIRWSGHTSANPSLFLQLFLSRTTNLKWLRLNFPQALQHDCEDLLVWLASPLGNGDSSTANHGISVHGKPAPVAFPSLQQLDIGSAAVSPRVLDSVFEKFSSSVKCLSLRRVKLVDENSIDFAKVNMWSKFFKRLAPASDLHTITLGYLSQGPKSIQSLSSAHLQSLGPHRAYRVRLGSGGDTNSERLYEERSYSGPAMGRFLHTLAAEVTVAWPTSVDSSGSSDFEIADEDYESTEGDDEDDDMES